MHDRRVKPKRAAPEHRLARQRTRSFACATHFSPCR